MRPAALPVPHTRSMDRHTADPLARPSLHELAVRFNARNRRAGPARLAEPRCQFLVRRQGLLRIQPAALLGHSPESRNLVTAHRLRARDLPIRIALAHPNQNLFGGSGTDAGAAPVTSLPPVGFEPCITGLEQCSSRYFDSRLRSRSTRNASPSPGTARSAFGRSVEDSKD
jgi:hypothetical protein